jgi:hypothetical protein
MGITYRSKIKHNLGGRDDFSKPGLLRKFFRNGPVHAELMLPDEYSLGVVFAPLNRATV